MFWMRLHLAVLVGCSIFGLTGCAHRVSIAAPSAPTIPGTNDKGDIDITKSINITKIYNADSYKKDFAIYTTAVNTSLTDSTQLAKAKQARNNIIWGEMGAIESVYTVYHTRLFSDKNLISVGSDTMTLGLTAASTIATHAPTKTILSALGTAFAGIGLSIDKNYFGQQSFQILGVAMQTRRDKVRAVIASNLASCDVNSYPLLQAQRDLIQYFGSGTLDSAVQELQEEAGAASSSAASGANPATPSTTTTLPVTACTSAAFTGTPTFTPPAGQYTTSQTVTIASATAGATIYYTTDGSVPTTSSAKYANPIQVSATETIQAIATATGYTTSAVASASYTIAPAGGTAAAMPSFTPLAGQYTTTQTVIIASATAGATIYYTIDGSVPTTSSAKYSSPIQVSSTETIQAIATATGYTTSAVASASYTIAPAGGTAAATPSFTPLAGQYTTTQTVTIASATAGATIYYTTDGSVPTTSSAKYSSPIQVSSTRTIQAMATSPGYATSPLASATYTIIATPLALHPALTPH